VVDTHGKLVIIVLYRSPNFFFFFFFKIRIWRILDLRLIYQCSCSEPSDFEDFCLCLDTCLRQLVIHREYSRVARVAETAFNVAARDPKKFLEGGVW
jgi:hypothetical protein